MTRSAGDESLYISKIDSHLEKYYESVTGNHRRKWIVLFTDDVSRRTAPADKHNYKADAEKECDAMV